MSLIIAPSTLSILARASYVSTRPEASSTSKKVYDVSSLYLGPGTTNLGGMTNVISTPYEFYLGLKASYDAYKIRDYEGIFENNLRILAAPLRFGGAGLQLCWNAAYIGTLLKVLNQSEADTIIRHGGSFFWAIAGVGFALCALQGTLEAIGLFRSGRFYQKFFSSSIQSEERSSPTDSAEIPMSQEADKSASEEATIVSQLKKLESSYFQITPAEKAKIDIYVKEKLGNQPIEQQVRRKEKIIKATLKIKKNALARRIHPWLVKRAENALLEIPQNLQSLDEGKRIEAREKGKLLLKNVKIQAQKSLLINTIGLLAVLVTMAGLIAGSVSCPFMIPFILLLVGTILTTTRYYLYRGLMDSEGWDFSVSNCIPNFLKMIFQAKTTKEYNSNRPFVLALPYIDQNSSIMAEIKRREEFFSRHNFTMSKSFHHRF